MRPLRIRAEGFSAYRSSVEVDLEDVDFFSIAGATGSGKSSLVDAMIFALFGRVPRLGGNAVAPAITAGADQARVAVDFEVEGTGYTAVRFAQRTPSGGASVKEARLQEGEVVLAEGADQVTRAVEGLLKLRFEDFTRTVVLPQGEFARFLNATKSERQALLRNLLGLDIYTRVRELARTRESVAKERAEGARSRQETLDLPDEETASRSRERLEALEKLSESIVERCQDLDRLYAALETASNEVMRIEGATQRLDAIKPPDRLEALDHLAAAARESVAESEKDLSNAHAAVKEVEGQVAVLPSKDEIASTKKAQQRLSQVQERLDRSDLDGARARVETAESELLGASETLTELKERLDAVRVSHAAHALTAGLVVGEPCPVCEQEVTSLPRSQAPSAIAEIEELQADASAGVEAARSRVDDARREVTQIETSRAEQESQRTQLLGELVDAPAREELVEMEELLSGLGEELVGARTHVEAKEGALREARSELEDLADSVRRVGKDLTSAQLQVADLEPVISESDDVIVQWKDLMQWREDARHRLVSEVSTAKKRVVAAEVTARAARADLVAALDAVEVTATEPYAVQVASAFQVARQLVEKHEKALSESSKLQTEIEKGEGEAAVAGALANHMKANGFEQWLMVGALSDLVTGANGLLAQLSDGGYSLHSDEAGSFSIVDHRNADEMRSVSTLSGGETFLVSLALALSLAETLARGGGANLDAIILDEGFGTLDDESLDTVASVLEELAGRGLMVGVITHVKELASRAPVRFEVSTGSSGSEVVLVS